MSVFRGNVRAVIFPLAFSAAQPEQDREVGIYGDVEENAGEGMTFRRFIGSVQKCHSGQI